ncbi:MAG: hypothetical protein NVSMB46_01890 [Candidatus Saccharimonadales bacterium]
MNPITNESTHQMNELPSEQLTLDILQQAVQAAERLVAIQSIADNDHSGPNLKTNIGAVTLLGSAILGNVLSSPVIASAETVQLQAQLQSYSVETPHKTTHTLSYNNTITVRPGDTLTDIAEERGMKLSDLEAINNRHINDPNIIFPGQQLLVSNKICKPGEVLIAPDDSLSVIAEKLHTTVPKLIENNKSKITNPDVIYTDECYDMATQKKVVEPSSYSKFTEESPKTTVTSTVPAAPKVDAPTSVDHSINQEAPPKIKPATTPAPAPTPEKKATNGTLTTPHGATLSGIAEVISKDTGSPYPSTLVWLEKHNPYGGALPEGKPLPIPVSPDVVDTITKDIVHTSEIAPPAPVTVPEKKATNTTITIPKGSSINSIAEVVSKDTGSPLPQTKEWIEKHNPYGAVIPEGKPLPVPVSPDAVAPIATDIAHAAEAAPPVVVQQSTPEKFQNNLDAIPAINGTSADTVKFIVKGLESTGITSKAAAWIAGSIIQESSGNPTAAGDYVNGTPTAFGYIQAHAPRSNDMPSDGLEQLKFIVNHDIPSEGSALNSYMHSSSNVSNKDYDKAIQEWERFGELGKRDEYARAIEAALNTPKNTGSASSHIDNNQNNNSNDSAPPKRGNQSNIPAVSWIFDAKKTEQFERVDEGWDIRSTPGSTIKAVAAGVIKVANADPGGFGNDYPIEILDQNSVVSGWTDTFYYGHVHVDPNKIGKHVEAGEAIAVTNTYEGENGSAAPTGWVEVGLAKSGTGAPLQNGEGETAAGHKMKDILINAPVIPSQSNK